MNRPLPLIALLLLAALSACGQTGPLFVPPPEEAPAATADDADEDSGDETDRSDDDA